jgi:peptidoglycan L-alanyl-D-glutamate endopeptidase CwlK
MTFFLGQKSEETLIGVDPRIVQCARRAIATTSVDFSVFEGLRSKERQEMLFREGASRRLDSYHLTGHALDLVPFVAGRLQWQMPLCIQVAISMREAAVHFGVPITWGAVWDRELSQLDPRELDDEIEAYVARYRIKHGPKRRPLIDGPHFQVER